jgi:predicted transcriptional regulator
MKNPNLSQQATAQPSLTSILKKISENKAHVIFNNLATSNNNGRFIPPLKEMNLSTKQYYSRLSGLLEAGLIKRDKSIYSLTYLERLFMTHR